MTTATEALAIHPPIEFPRDPGLQDLPKLFDPDWIWRTYQKLYGDQDVQPANISVRQFSHSSGRSALISYLLEWKRDEYLPTQHISVKTARGKPVELFRYPDDDHLPGLVQIANPETALELVNQHVLAFRARRIRVQLVRYRPGSRAVLRHKVGSVKLFARSLRPSAVPTFVNASELVARSTFVVPRIAGHWIDGAVLWMTEIPGKNLRREIVKGRPPETAPLLEGLESLWNTSQSNSRARPFNLAGAYSTARRTFRHKVRDNHNATRHLKDAVEILDPFVKSWKPTTIAHNDFYDDQLLALPDGRIALVDLEEAGPGDPMLDIGNFLAHLRWVSQLGSIRENDASGPFYHALKNDALQRFRWDPRQLALREAVCLFRLCTNMIRHPRPDWQLKLERGLSEVNQSLA